MKTVALALAVLTMSCTLALVEPSAGRNRLANGEPSTVFSKPIGIERARETARVPRDIRKGKLSMNECGKWHPDAIERQLAHVENNDVRRAHARAEHWDERVRMMQWWADYLGKLQNGCAETQVG